MDLIKDLFVSESSKIKKPQFLTMMLLVLLSYRVCFPIYSKPQYELLRSEISKIKIIFEIWEVIVGLTFTLSLICIAIAIVTTTAYIAVNFVEDKYCSDKHWRDKKSSIIHRYFVSSKINVIKVNMWFVIVVCYFYILNESQAVHYFKNITRFIAESGLILQVISFGYFLFILTALMFLIKSSFNYYYYFESSYEE